MKTKLLLLYLLAWNILSAQSSYYVKFPGHAVIHSCDSLGINGFGKPECYNPDSLDLFVSYEDEIYTVIVPYSCLKIDRTWKVYNKATYDTTKFCTVIPTAYLKNAPIIDSTYLQPVIVAPNNALQDWAPTTIYYPQDTFYCSDFWSDTANCYLYRQLLYVRDTQPPYFFPGQITNINLIDTTDNSPDFWRASYWTNPATGLHDMEETALDLAASGRDQCTGPYVSISFDLWLDLDGDGFQETVVPEYSNGLPAGTLRFNNYTSPVTGGEIREFDNRAVPANQKYYFTCERVSTANETTLRVRWATQANPHDYVLPQLPPGHHKIVWTIADACVMGENLTVQTDITGAVPSGGFAGVAIKWPDDLITTQCSNSNYNAPEILNVNGLPIVTTYEDEYSLSFDACYKLTRTWKVYNTDSYDPGQPGVAIPNPNPNAIANHPANLPGPVLSPSSQGGVWAPTVVKVYPTDPAPTNYSSFWQPDANFYAYKQIIKVNDVAEPEIYACPQSGISATDTTANDTSLWHAAYWLDHQSSSNDLPETPLVLALEAFDSCSGTDINGSYFLLLDLDQDGVAETVVSNMLAQTPGAIRYNNLNTPGYSGGELRVFDQRNVPDNEKYRFSLLGKTVNGHRIMELGWTTVLMPGTLIPMQLPPGAHRVKWQISDGCGLSALCNYDVTVPFDSTVAVTNPTKGDGVTVLPNPFKDKILITCSLPEPGPVSIVLFDATGRLLYEQQADLITTSQTFEIYLSKISGMVYYAVKTKDQLHNGKLISLE